jgi:hypothetical protein
MLKELDIAGVYIAPFCAYLLAAGLTYLPVKFIFDRVKIERFVWHRSLFDFAAFLIILGIIAATGRAFS